MTVEICGQKKDHIKEGIKKYMSAKSEEKNVEEEMVQWQKRKVFWIL